MPQMFPLNWIMLFLYFCILFMITNIFIYFNYPTFFKNNINQKKKIKKINWKW